MSANITINPANSNITKQQKAIYLYKFIEEMNKIKQKVVLNISDYPKYISLKEIPNDTENIHIYFRDSVDVIEEDIENNVLLSIRKPEFQHCPEPDDLFFNWLNDGWDSFITEVSVKKYIELDKLQDKLFDEEVEGEIEYFEDNSERVQLYENWKIKRNNWAEKQKVYVKTRDLFSELYKIYVEFERNSENVELIVADGFIREKDLPNIDHPVLTRRVQIRHDAVKNIIYIEDSDCASELYTTVFQNMEDVQLSAINRINDELLENDYHPLDRNDLPLFFKELIYRISSDSIYSEEGVPNNWQQNNKFLLYRNPCYIFRKRLDGTVKAIGQIIENIEDTGAVPAAISDLVEGGKIDIPKEDDEISIEEQLAAVGGESIDILLSKEANKEQLEIAKRIERYNAVLVQGPPGTGKTHTIANLMGHFLAQGKSVLVTSHTQKALKVLKDKVAPGLQNLCVSVIDDSNIDMEKSVDGITNYMAQVNSFEIKKAMENLALERKDIINELAKTRKKLFTIINKENNNIVYNGEGISLSAAAAFVHSNMEKLSYIPGKVVPFEPLPLNLAELTELYRSNRDISLEDESELESNLPSPTNIIAPYEFENLCKVLAAEEVNLTYISNKCNWQMQNLIDENKIIINSESFKLELNYPDINLVTQLKDYVASFTKLEPWMLKCVVDGKACGSYRQLWNRLIEQIEKTCKLSEKVTEEKFGKAVEIINDSRLFYNALKQLREKYTKKSKIGWIDSFFNKDLKVALQGATINGKAPETVEDCDLIIHCIELNENKNQCANYWNQLMLEYGNVSFDELDKFEQERVAEKYIPLIKRYLDWYSKEYEQLIAYIDLIGIDHNILFRTNSLDSETVATEKILTVIDEVLPDLCDLLITVNNIFNSYQYIQLTKKKLLSEEVGNSLICKNMLSAIYNRDIELYQNEYGVLKSTYEKYALKRQREEYLQRLMNVAPQWADEIKNRVGIHGSYNVPEDILDAWKWKQYNAIIEEITAESYSELQKKSLYLSQQYRKITAQYAEKCAWYHLLRKTEDDISMKQALIGWKQTVKKIGKGTGKNAPKYRAEARKLMAKCQEAVPGWIMPIGKALENLNPKTNKFDVIIIDEASQADISALAILYMGKKLIIVGDDKQVSPMAIGIEIDKMNALQDMYITDKIPNAHLYDAKTSIYEIAATTFQPLMLREHFRCVPEIIGFSNWLSYDFKIKPLRDESNSVLLPAVVNYRVANGERNGKTNVNEAKAIVALIQACLEQPEYDGKTFGIISLLGDEQVKVLQSEIYKHIDSKECTNRKILCGNSSNFQGDERDVIFLSLVECANGNGPVPKIGFGPDDAYRKRYNVAASRAKDQLWVVDSLDPANDLKPDDLRKKLIDYSLNPDSVNMLNMQINKKSESPFEAAVAKALVCRGYHLIQQWNVGAYRLDMVAVCGTKKIAIECDGERYHSGETKIREDMERQTILERLGWRFIRIRGSEYYRNPEKTIEKVIKELQEYEIYPESSNIVFDNKNRNSELLQRVKSRAEVILKTESKDEVYISIGTIEEALNNKLSISEETIKKNTVKAKSSKSKEVIKKTVILNNDSNKHSLIAKSDIKKVTAKNEMENDSQSKQDKLEYSNIRCEKCGRLMVYKQGRFGKFLSCSGFPECWNTEFVSNKIDVECPLCGGDLVVRKTKTGKVFYGCDNYPKCKFTSWDRPTSEKCPECGEMLYAKTDKYGKRKLFCINENCANSIKNSQKR